MSYEGPNLSPPQLKAIVGTERAMSSLSIASSLFVLGTFLGSNLFQTPINRLIFYATFGNILANVATMIGRSGLHNRTETNALCQFQGFFIQWFVGADSLWIFCVAFNVYLTLFRYYSPRDLRKLEWRYFLVCYGIPFVPALVFLCINTDARGPIYGRATLWCWIRPEWDGFRMGFFYGPIWFVILLTFSILLYAAKEILVSRKHVKQVTTDRIWSADNFPGPAVPPNWTMQPDLHINEPDVVAGVDRGVGERVDDISPTTTVGSAGHQATDEPEAHPSLTVNTVTHSTSVSPHQSAAPSPPQFGNPGAPQSDAEPSSGPYADGPVSLTSTDQRDNIFGATPPRRDPGYDFQPQNRSSPRISIQQNQSGSSRESAYSLHRRASIERRTAAYLYSKRAVLFFVALLITWTPPSINRIYLLCSPDNPIFVLSYLESLTLPLQGFWNCVIYITTSMDAVKALWGISTSTVMYKLRGSPGDDRRPSWESALQRARRKRREMSLGPPDYGLEMGRGSGITPAGGGLVGAVRSSQDSRESVWGVRWLGRWWDRMSDAGSTARRSSQESLAKWAGFLGKKTRAPSAGGTASAPAAAGVRSLPGRPATTEVPTEDSMHHGHISAPPMLVTQVLPEQSEPPTSAPSESRGSASSKSRSPARSSAGSGSSKGRRRPH